MPPLGLGLAIAIGLTLGLLGGGGSILTVPVLVYVLGFKAKAAVASSLLVVGVTSAVGALGHWRAGNVVPRTAATFGLLAMLGAFAGARLASYVSAGAQLALFAAVMLVAGGMMLRPIRPPADVPTAARNSGSFSRAALPLTGVGVGVLTGLVGVGGGFLVVPALAVLARMPMRHAVGTSLVVIAMNAAAGYAGYAGRVAVPWGPVALFTLLAVAGIVAGTRLAGVVPQTALRRAFALLLLLTGGAVLYENRGALTRPAVTASPLGPER